VSNYPPGCTQAMHDRHYADAGPCPECEAEEWRQRVLCLLDEAPMSTKDRALYVYRLKELSDPVHDDVRDYTEREGGVPCTKHAPKRDDYED
jgi:hypothetical protein